MEEDRTRKPNIVIITTHDSGCHFGCYGAGGVRTPCIDALAADGVRFDRMFAPASMCTPSRGSLLTGTWPDRNGLLGLSGPMWCYELSDPRIHLSNVLRRNGYRTALCGFQHEAIADADLGFDSVYPLADGERRRSALEISEAAADFLRSSRGGQTPFYLQIGFFETHTPYRWADLHPDEPGNAWVPPYTGYPRDDEKLNLHIAEFQASINRVDQAVGTITRTLDEAGLSDETLLVFNTDHGPELPRAKWTMFDAGLRVAFILRWPGGGLSGGRTVDAFLGNLDFLPTLAELTGIEVSHGMDGRSFARILRGASTVSPRRVMYHSFLYGLNWAVRTERYKLVRSFAGTMYNAERFREGSKLPEVMLFDLESDPYEQHDVCGNPGYRAVRDELDGLLWAYLEDAGSPVLAGHIRQPPIRKLLHEYESQRGAWAEADDPDLLLTVVPPARYSSDLGGRRLVVDFAASSNYRPYAIAFYDTTLDPSCERNVADDPRYAEVCRTMRAKLWARLEKTDNPVLRGLEPSETHAKCLSDYRAWKRRALR